MALDKFTQITKSGIVTTINFECHHLYSTGIATFSSGNISAVDGTFTGDVSIGGTLTYQDVTNIDSVGLVTARLGLNVTAGVSTFAALIDANGGVDISGGSGLVASTAKISDLTDNRVVIGGSSGELEDSANLTFDGSNLGVGSKVTVTNANADADNTNSLGAEINAAWIRLGDVTAAKSFSNGLGIKFYDQGTAHWSAGTIGNKFYIAQTSNDGNKLFPSGRTDGITIDSTANVGINETSPVAKLHIQGSADAPCLVLPDTTNTRYSVGFGNINVSGVGQRLDFYAGDSGNNSNNLTSAHRRMSLTSQGRLGIGLTNPASLLHAENLSGAAEIILKSSTQPRLMLKTTGTSAECRVDFGDSGDSSRGAIGYNHTDDALKFYTSGVANEKLRITSGGLVGINTSAPTAQLSFLAKRSTQTYPPICFQTSYGAGLADAAISTTDDSGGTDIMMGSNVYMGQNGAFVRYMSGYGSAAVRCQYTGKTLFYNKSGNNAPEESMRIDGDGRLKVNHTDHPGQLDDTFLSIYDANSQSGISKNYAMIALHNYGTGSPGDVSGIGFGAGASFAYTKASIGFQRTTSYGRGDLVFCTNNDGDTSLVNDTDERLRITTDGYVHAGNTGHGTNKVGGQAITGQDYDPYVKIYANTSNHWLAQLRSDNTSGNGVFIRAGNASSNYPLYVCGYDENNAFLTVNGKGAVGIGTNAPGQSNVPGIHIRTESSDDCRIAFQTPTKNNSRIGYFGLSNRFGMDVCNGFEIRDAADSYETRFQITSAGAVRLYHNGGSVKFATTSWGAQPHGDVIPHGDNTRTLGWSNERWTQLYAASGSINTSDRTEKNTIVDSDLGLSFINKLKPVSYKFNSGVRTHYGLIAQDIEDVLPGIGKTTGDFAAFIKTDNPAVLYEESEDTPEGKEVGDVRIPAKITYGLRYSEFISPLIKAVQELSAKVDALESS